MHSAGQQCNLSSSSQSEGENSPNHEYLSSILDTKSLIIKEKPFKQKVKEEITTEKVANRQNSKPKPYPRSESARKVIPEFTNSGSHSSFRVCIQKKPASRNTQRHKSQENSGLRKRKKKSSQQIRLHSNENREASRKEIPIVPIVQLEHMKKPKPINIENNSEEMLPVSVNTLKLLKCRKGQKLRIDGAIHHHQPLFSGYFKPFKFIPTYSYSTHRERAENTSIYNTPGSAKSNVRIKGEEYVSHTKSSHHFRSLSLEKRHKQRERKASMYNLEDLRKKWGVEMRRLRNKSNENVKEVRASALNSKDQQIINLLYKKQRKTNSTGEFNVGEYNLLKKEVNYPDIMLYISSNMNKEVIQEGATSTYSGHKINNLYNPNTKIQSESCPEVRNKLNKQPKVRKKENEGKGKKGNILNMEGVKSVINESICESMNINSKSILTRTGENSTNWYRHLANPKVPCI